MHSQVSILILSIAFLSSPTFVWADERLNVWPWFYNLVTQGGGTVTVLSPDGVFDTMVYIAHTETAGEYRMRVGDFCAYGDWWIDRNSNTLHSIDPIVDPQGTIGYELYRSTDGLYYIQPDRLVVINGVSFQPYQLTTVFIATTNVGNGC